MERMAGYTHDCIALPNELCGLCCLLALRSGCAVYGQQNELKWTGQHLSGSQIWRRERGRERARAEINEIANQSRNIDETANVSLQINQNSAKSTAFV